jgi:hypothetical protein
LPVNSWALRSLADSLQDRGLASICPSNNQNSELEFWESARALLRSHSDFGQQNGRVAQEVSWDHGPRNDMARLLSSKRKLHANRDGML